LDFIAGSPPASGEGGAFSPFSSHEAVLTMAFLFFVKFA
jgi:hypothetical protein